MESTGADLICTTISITRGAMILAGVSRGQDIISVLEVRRENLPTENH